MNITNIEIKCPINNPNDVIVFLNKEKARFFGEDNQTDTYFKTETGKLKLREGKIENAIIRYQRSETTDLKKSDIKLQMFGRNMPELRDILSETYGVVATVYKRRMIYYLDNIKFLVDYVKGLGFFIEIEVSDQDGKYSEEEMRITCEKYIDLLGLDRTKFIDKSYCDMILELI